MFRPNLQNGDHRRAWEILQSVPERQKSAFLVQAILENARKNELETVLRRILREDRRWKKNSKPPEPPSMRNRQRTAGNPQKAPKPMRTRKRPMTRNQRAGTATTAIPAKNLQRTIPMRIPCKRMSRKPGIRARMKMPSLPILENPTKPLKMKKKPKHKANNSSAGLRFRNSPPSGLFSYIFTF